MDNPEMKVVPIEYEDVITTSTPPVGTPMYTEYNGFKFMDPKQNAYSGNKEVFENLTAGFYWYDFTSQASGTLGTGYIVENIDTNYKNVLVVKGSNVTDLYELITFLTNQEDNSVYNGLYYFSENNKFEFWSN